MHSLRFHISTAPVSQQASGTVKADFKATVRSAISNTAFFLTGEVRLNVDWMIHDRIRYETDTAPDVDNILKPTIDALTGPDGVLIDDCQVQRVNCGWIDSSSDDQSVDIELEYFKDEMIPSRTSCLFALKTVCVFRSKRSCQTKLCRCLCLILSNVWKSVTKFKHSPEAITHLFMSCQSKGFFTGLEFRALT